MTLSCNDIQYNAAPSGDGWENSPIIQTIRISHWLYFCIIDKRLLTRKSTNPWLCHLVAGFTPPNSLYCSAIAILLIFSKIVKNIIIIKKSGVDYNRDYFSPFSWFWELLTEFRKNPRIRTNFRRFQAMLELSLTRRKLQRFPLKFLSLNFLNRIWNLFKKKSHWINICRSRNWGRLELKEYKWH